MLPSHLQRQQQQAVSIRPILCRFVPTGIFRPSLPSPPPPTPSTQYHTGTGLPENEIQTANQVQLPIQSFKYHDRTTGQLIVYRHHSLDCHKKHVKEQGRPESDARAVVEFMAGDPAFLASSAEWRRARMYKERKDVENQGMDEKIGGSNDGSNAGVVPEQQKEE